MSAKKYFFWPATTIKKIIPIINMVRLEKMCFVFSICLLKNLIVSCEAINGTTISNNKLLNKLIASIDTSELELSEISKGIVIGANNAPATTIARDKDEFPFMRLVYSGEARAGGVALKRNKLIARVLSNGETK